jgi:4-amino-4-deoxy-L-arabinose transferase-like glycosyltransferase
LSALRNLALAALLSTVAFLCFFSRLDALGLVGPDEPRYAAVAREMARSGDWVTPRLAGEPWLEKPPLYYWGAAAAFSLFGVNEFAARLPSALSALAATLALGWTAWRLYGASAGWAVLLIFPSTIGALGFARGASTDMVFSASLAVALAAAAEIVLLTPTEARPRRRWEALLGVGLGLAVLAKGPAGVLLAGGSVLLWAAASGRWRDALRPLSLRVILWFAVIALPWYVVCGLVNPEFVRVFLLGHNLERYLTPVFQHVQPFWFFGPVVLAGLVPWTVLLAGVAGDAISRGRALRHSPGFFVACWVVFPVAFFSLSQSKLPGYVLPALGPLVVLMARSLTRPAHSGRPTARWLLAAVGATLVAIGATGSLWLERLPAPASELDLPRAGVWLGILVAAGVVVALFALLRQQWIAVAIVALVVAGLTETANRRIVPQLDPHLTPRAAAHLARQAEVSPDSIRVYRLHRAWHYGLNFYLDTTLDAWEEQDGPAWVFTSETGERELEARGLVERVASRASRQAVLLRTR